MRLILKGQSLWALAVYFALGLSLASTMTAHAARQASLHDVSGDDSRMAFKESKKNKKEPSCQLTLMHVYTSKFNQKHAQFAFTGSLVAKREAGKPMVLSVIGQNHQLVPGGKGIQAFPLPRIELGVEDVSVRHFSQRKASCKKNSVCAEYKDTKKHEFQTWVSDGRKQLSLLFPLANKQPSVVIDLSKFGPAGKASEPPLTQFKACAANLR
jgi:hypothetical protein